MTEITLGNTCQKLHLSGETIKVVVKKVSHPAFALLNLERDQVWQKGAGKEGISLRPECVQEAGKAESGNKH